MIRYRCITGFDGMEANRDGIYVRIDDHELVSKDAELATLRARVEALETAIDRLQILGHSAFQGGWQRVAEMMSEFDAIVTASIGDDVEVRMSKRIDRTRGEFYAARASAGERGE